MLMITTQNLPEGFKIKQVFPLVMAVHTFQLSKKHIIAKLFGDQEEKLEDVFNDLASQAPAGANAIIGIQLSSTSQQFSNGALLYLTAIGTPAFVDHQ